jgi:allantoate deiminase
MLNSELHQTIAEEHILPVVEEIVKRCDALASVSDCEKGLTRLFCSPSMEDTHRCFENWFHAVDMDCHLDAVGNLIGRKSSAAVAAKTDRPVLIIGSHLDTVIDAGRFDGTLGVLLGLGVAEILHRANVELNFDLEIVGFSEEEGIRYMFPFIGSLGMVGELTSEALDRVDQDSISMREALRDFGCEVDSIESASYRQRNLIGFMEAHIEQADSLQCDNLPIGVVTSIAGQTRADICFTGKAAHAGTAPHDRRQDALAAAAELILKIEEIGQQTQGLFATVGYIKTHPGLSNVISAKAELRLDLRHELDDVRNSSFEKIKTAIDSISSTRKVNGEVVHALDTAATPMDSQLTEHLLESIENSGLAKKTMVSGAGHDAMIMAKIAPSCMLFVRCKDGISHNSDEYVSPQDIEAATRLMVAALLRISDSLDD